MPAKTNHNTPTHASVNTYGGGMALTNDHETQDPPIDPNEMGFPDTACVVRRLSLSPYRSFFEAVWGAQRYGDAIDFNQMLLSKGVAGVPGGAFADSEEHNQYMRLCIAREDEILRGALERIQNAVSQGA